jgi:hypothetical protein
VTKPEPCNCSIVQLLLRYHGMFSDSQVGEAIEPFIVSLFASYEFKNYFSVQFVKFFRFMVCKTDETSWKWSKLEALQYQTLTSEQLSFVAFTQNNPRDFLLSLLNITSKPFYPIRMDSLDWRFQVLHAQATLIELLRNKRVRIAWSKDAELMDGYLQIFSLIQKHRYEFTSAINHGGMDGDFYTQALDSCYTKTLFCERAITLNLILEFYSLSSQIPGDDFEAALLRRLHGHVTSLCGERLKSDFRELALTCDITIERLFVLFFSISVAFQKTASKLLYSSWNQERAAAVLAELTEDKDVILWKCLLARFSKVVGFMREVTRGLWVNWV